MDNSENDKLWEMMSEYNFLAVHKVPADLICSICNKLIVDARISPCGCRYCKGCIEEHLSNECNFCPCKKSECEEEELELDANIWIDHVVNRRVAKVIVKCPIKMCKYQDTITKILEHVEICKKQSVKCPYYEFGCDYINASGDDIKKHIESDKNRHMDQLVTKIGEKEEENQSLHNEIVLLKKYLETKQIQVEGVEKQLETLNKKMDQIIENQNIELNQSKLNLEKKQKEIENQNIELNQSKLNLNKKQKEIDDLTTKLSCFYGLKIKEFTWVIDLFLNKINQAKSLTSDMFYTHANGYKMFLKIVCASTYGSYELSLQMASGLYNQSQRFPMEIELNLGFVITDRNEYFFKERQVIAFPKAGASSPLGSINSNCDIQCNPLTILCFIKVIK